MDEIDGSGYTRGGSRAFIITGDGTIIGPTGARWIDFKTVTVKMALLPTGVGSVWDPDAPEGDPRRDPFDPR